MKPRKRTDVRDDEAAMEPVRQGIEERVFNHLIEAWLRQAYLDDPHSGANDLPLLVPENVEVIELGRGCPR